MSILWQDFRYSVRALSRSPGFAIVAVSSLAIGIGASTAIFSLLDAVLLRPFPVSNPEELVSVRSLSPDGRELGLSQPDFLDYSESQTVFSGLVAHRRLDFSISGQGFVDRVSGDAVSSNYFRVLGVAIPLGRGFNESSRLDATIPEIVISHRLWQRYFGGDPSVLADVIKVNGRFFSIMGVAPPRFTGLRLGSAADIWISQDTLEPIMPVWYRAMALSTNRGARDAADIVGRLEPGVTIDRAAIAMDTRARQLSLAYPENEGWMVRLHRFSQQRASGAHMDAVLPFGAILVTTVALVLLIACANVATLLLVRTFRRQRETDIRGALGASRSQIIQWILMEQALLYGAGLLASIPIAAWSIRLLGSLPLFSWVELPLPVSGAAASFDPRLDHRVMGFAVIAMLTTALLFAVGPAVRGSRFDSSRAQRTQAEGVASGSRRSRTQDVLVACQVGACVVLLMGAGLFARMWTAAREIDPGFEAETVAVASVDFNTMATRYDEPRAMDYYREALERARVLPGVRSATLGADVPLARRRVIIQFVPDDRTLVEEGDWIVTDCDIVGPDYFRTLGIPITRGRGILRRDHQTSPSVVVVNETMARTYWPGIDPIGRRIRVRGTSGVRTVEVVGVARDVKQRSLEADAETRVYLPLFQRYFPEMTLFVHVERDPASHLRTLRNELEQIDAELPVFNLKTLDEQVTTALSQRRTGTALLSLSGLLALGLAAFGIAGVTAYIATRRSREIAIRMAIGADAREVLKLILRQGMGPVVWGLGAGLVAGVGAVKLVASHYSTVGSSDAMTMAAPVALLLSVSAFASYLPARRAASADPAAGLRDA